MIHLEKKIKWGGLGTKQSVSLTASQVQAILDGEINWMFHDPRPLVKELYGKMKYTRLQPKTIVDYIREPFVYAPGNVRVTLDYDIRTGLRCTDFLNPACTTIPVQENPIVLEVKWDEYLPILIQNIVQTNNRQTAAFSKYAACRTYD